MDALTRSLDDIITERGAGEKRSSKPRAEKAAHPKAAAHADSKPITVVKRAGGGSGPVRGGDGGGSRGRRAHDSAPYGKV